MSKKRGTFWKCLVSAVCCLVTCVDRKKKTLRRMCNVVVLESFFFFFLSILGFLLYLRTLGGFPFDNLLLRR